MLIRRELHDGIGPALAGIGFGLAAAANLVDSTPPAARALLDRLTGDLRERLVAVRGLVRAMRDRRYATSTRATSRRSPGTSPRRPEITVDAAARDAYRSTAPHAAYLIAAEAVHNAVRHADAARHPGARVGAGGGHSRSPTTGAASCRCAPRASGSPRCASARPGRGARFDSVAAGRGTAVACASRPPRIRPIPSQHDRRSSSHDHFGQHRRMTARAHDISIVVVDDHPLFRVGIISMLETLARRLGRRSAATRRRGRRGRAAATRPTSCSWTSISANGSGCRRHARDRARAARSPGCSCSRCSGDDESVFAAVRSGARGYLLKTATPARGRARGARRRRRRACCSARDVVKRAVAYLSGAKTLRRLRLPRAHRPRERRCSSSLPAATTTRRSPAPSCSRARPCATTSTASSASSASGSQQLIVLARESGFGHGTPSSDCVRHHHRRRRRVGTPGAACP